LVRVGALVVGQLKDTRERGEHRRGRTYPPLLEPGVVVGADRGELRDLLPSEPGYAPMSRTLGQSDVARCQLRSAGLEELGELVLVDVQAAHLPEIVAQGASPVVGLMILGTPFPG